MLTSIKRHALPCLLLTTLVTANLAACGDDDDGGSASGSGGNSGSSGNGGSAGKAGSGGAKAGNGGGGKAGSAGSSGSGSGSGSGSAGKTAAGSGGAKAGSGGAPATADDAGAGNTDADVESEAANVRVKLDLLLTDHITLAAKATGAALGGRTDEFTAYQGLLNTNGTTIGSLVGAAFGNDARNSFNEIWSAHNGYFVAYTQAVIANDSTAKDAAVSDLTTKYVPMFAALLAPATGLEQADIESLAMEHVVGTKAIVDAQAAKNWDQVYSSYRDAFAHMKMIGDALSGAIVAKKADLFPGDPNAKSVNLRASLNVALQEHLYLATFATNAALRSTAADDDGANEFAAAGGALNDNGTGIGNVIGGLYDDAAKNTFNTIWSAHNGYFVAYTQAVAAGDNTAKEAAVSDLTTKYVPAFATFLNGATDLPVSTLTDLTTEHVTTTAAVVDAQAAKNYEVAATADLTAAAHMQMLGDPLSIAIVAKLPSKF